MSADVRAVFDAAPEGARAGMLVLRRLIFDLAAEMPEVGRLEEALRWGQPAYLTPRTKAGSTIRLGPRNSGGFALYAHCQTTLIADFRALAGDVFRYEGNRAVLFDTEADIRPDLLAALIRRALTWHCRRSVRPAARSPRPA